MIQRETQIKSAPASLRKRIRLYQSLANEIEHSLSQSPFEWGRYQSEFNWHVNGVFREIMDFEKENSENEEKVYKLKRLFINKIRKTFLRGELITWSLNKPFGYAGDFKVIDEIYKNEPSTNGFDRLFDNYFQMSAISVAVRNRKEDFKRLIENFLSTKHISEADIMDVASGPCRDVYEMLFHNERNLFQKAKFDCFDADNRSINYAKHLIRDSLNVAFTQMNVLRIALKKDIGRAFDRRYDVIYSTGLFDYLDEQISVRLLSNLKKLLKPNGTLIISDVRDKFSNPSVYFMEWVGDWNLIYRTDDNFRDVFLQSGFRKEQLSFLYEQQGIMQYIIAKL